MIDHFELLPIEECKRWYPELWKAFTAIFPEADDQQLAQAVSLTIDVCPYCYENVRGCQCWNDE